MSITKRPISFDLTDIEESNIKPVVFSYDFPDIDPVYEKEKDNYDLVHKDFNEVPMNIKGVGYDISSKESNVSFDGTNYKLLDLIFTKGMDNTNGNSSNPDYEYAFVLKLQGVSSSKYMYIFIPIEDSTNQGPENMVEFLAYDPKKKSEDKKKNRPKLQLNALIPSALTYYYYEYKNNLVLFFDTSTISLNMNGGGILTNSKWASNVQNNTVLTNNIYQGSSSVNQSIMSYADMGEIYIDCQPVDGGENEIIKPRNVYKMTPLFDSENMSKSSIYLLSVCFALFLFLVSIGIFNIVKSMTSIFKPPSSPPKINKIPDYVLTFFFIVCLVISFFVACLQLSSSVYSIEMKQMFKIAGYVIVPSFFLLFFLGVRFSNPNITIMKIIYGVSRILFGSSMSEYRIVTYLLGYLIGLCVILYCISLGFIHFFLTIENKDENYYKNLLLFVFFSSPLLMTGLFCSIPFLYDKIISQNTE